MNSLIFHSYVKLPQGTLRFHERLAIVDPLFMEFFLNGNNMNTSSRIEFPGPHLISEGCMLSMIPLHHYDIPSGNQTWQWKISL